MSGVAAEPGLSFCNSFYFPEMPAPILCEDTSGNASTSTSCSSVGNMRDPLNSYMSCVLEATVGVPVTGRHYSFDDYSSAFVTVVQVCEYLILGLSCSYFNSEYLILGLLCSYFACIIGLF